MPPMHRGIFLRNVSAIATALDCHRRSLIGHEIKSHGRSSCSARSMCREPPDVHHGLLSVVDAGDDYAGEQRVLRCRQRSPSAQHRAQVLDCRPLIERNPAAYPQCRFADAALLVVLRARSSRQGVRLTMTAINARMRLIGWIGQTTFPMQALSADKCDRSRAFIAGNGHVQAAVTCARSSRAEHASAADLLQHCVGTNLPRTPCSQSPMSGSESVKVLRISSSRHIFVSGDDCAQLPTIARATPEAFISCAEPSVRANDSGFLILRSDRCRVACNIDPFGTLA